MCTNLPCAFPLRTSFMPHMLNRSSGNQTQYQASYPAAVAWKTHTCEANMRATDSHFVTFKLDVIFDLAEALMLHV